ncbi:MAG: type II secretion system protein GspM [Geminicoccaceae bacterium]
MPFPSRPGWTGRKANSRRMPTERTAMDRRARNERQHPFRSRDRPPAGGARSARLDPLRPPARPAGRARAARTAHRRPRKQISTREDLLAEVRLLERTSPLAALLLHGDTAALAGAELQGRTDGHRRGRRRCDQPDQVLPGRDADPFVQIGSRIDFTVSMTGLRDILHAIESNEPVMIIDRITLATERSGAAEIGEHVQASMEIAAFSQKVAP